ATHLARATAYRQMRLLDKAEREYEAALKYAPDDLSLHMALADTQYHARRFPGAIETLQQALRLSPDDPLIYAEMAHSYAALHRRDQTIRYVQAAEKAGQGKSAILLDTGDALLTLGDEQGAMERFARALQAPDADKVATRLLISRVFVREGKFDDARQQVSLGFAESRIGESAPVTADNLIEAANIFLAMNDYDLARTYFQRAKNAGAADEVIAIGMANADLAQGRGNAAQAELAALGNPADYAENYDYLLAMGTFYNQRHDTRRALMTFAHASQIAGDDPVAERQMEELAGQEGLRVTDKLSLGTDFFMNGIFDDETIFDLDRQIFGTTAANAPSPRSELETRWLSDFRYHQSGLPVISGFFQVRNARGQYSVPSDALIVNRNTYDYSLNGALNPIARMGPVTLQFNTGLQYTWRRDSSDPVDLNQDLFRQFVYMSSNSIGNWLTVQGSAFHESGPFSYKPWTSRELGADLNFIVGRPWGHTQLLAGYTVRDLQFDPVVREFFSTTTSFGVQHEFGQRLKVAVLGDYIRSWRAQDNFYYLAQAARPAGDFQLNINNRWSVEGNFAYSRGMGFHEYDNVQNSLLINYLRPFRRSVDDGVGEVPVEYPLRVSFGIQSASYFNFSGRGQTNQIRPVIRLTLF
ncbi:MAG TPA: tetratricopeptide repeat protein, partial [Aggregatilineales bacterium]|nr:tetratricopeptide repeat protein [Aggregatilineales bacterium]